jgi:hypothetical protein
LSRRVRRVLDGALSRAPGGWRWSTAAAFFAAGVAVPLAALNFVPAAPASAAVSQGHVAANAPAREPASPYYAGGQEESPGISSAIRNVVATSVAGALSAIHPHPAEDVDIDVDVDVDEAIDDARRGRRRLDDSVQRAISNKAMGVTPEYLASLRAAAPGLHAMRAEEAVSLKAVGVTADYVREISAAGYGHLDADDLVEARALNIRGDYVRGLAASGYRKLSIDELAELRAMGVTGADIERFRRAGFTRLTVDQLVEMKAVGVDPDDLREAERDDP